MKERYPLAWLGKKCEECGGIDHRRSDHREKKKRIESEKKEKTKKKKNDKKKIEKIDVAIETEREIVVEKREKKDIEILTEEIVKDKREIELREREEKVERREKEI